MWCLYKPTPSQVSVVPGSPVSAFIEPTVSGACALLTWRDAASDDPEGSTDLAR